MGNHKSASGQLQISKQLQNNTVNGVMSITINPVIKYMNQMFTKVLLNSFIFVMDIFCTGPTRKFGIIGITTCHQIKLVSVDYTHSQWNEISGTMKSNT